MGQKTVLVLFVPLGQFLLACWDIFLLNSLGGSAFSQFAAEKANIALRAWRAVGGVQTRVRLRYERCKKSFSAQMGAVLLGF